MRQVPCYLIIGRGRLAAHISHYFTLKNISYHQWHRDLSLTDLYTKEKCSTHILVAISDRAIHEFIQTHFSNSTKLLIHFSGALSLSNCFSVHPLMTFSQALYSLTDYENIPFILEKDTVEFSQLFPQLNNPHAYLNKELKPKYHALCVLSGNFTTILWQKAMKTFADELGLSQELLFPYAQKILHNLLEHPNAALTGPLARQDQTTIQNNLTALQNDPFQSVYESMVKAYQKTLHKT